MTNLWLFDIDGTLVDINHLHLQSYKTDYSNHGLSVPDKAITDTFGMSERETHTAICRAMEIEPNQELLDTLVREHPANFLGLLRATPTIKPLEGVTALLTYLQNESEIIAAVTGNLQEPATAILEKSELLPYFRFITYDDGNSTRAQLVQRAIQEATGKHYQFQKVIVIGDTTKDIEAGKAAAQALPDIGLLTVGVATGSDSIETLRAVNPDIVVQTLREYRTIITAIDKTRQ